MLSNLDQAHKANFSLIQKNNLEDSQARASIRDFFMEQDSTVIQGLLKQDLSKYYNDGQDVDDMKLIILFLLLWTRFVQCITSHPSSNLMR